MRIITGKRAVVTGAASGIGRAIAVALSKENARLALVDVDGARLRALADELRPAGLVDVYECDLSQAASIDQLVSELSIEPVDLLINNAGVAFYGPTETMSREQWDWLLSVNLHAPIRLTQALLPSMLQRPEPHVVNMCSISGLVAGGRFAAYHVSKFGLIGFTEALRAEFGRRGLGVSAICPGPVATDLYKSAASGRADRSVPEPPSWMTTTPEVVAARTVKAIRRNQRMALITPAAHLLYQMKRFAPGLIDFANQLSRKSIRRRRAARALALREAEEFEQQRRAA